MEAGATAASGAIPVTVLTGYLGAGKTTLLNHLLKTKPAQLNLAVINNEFALEIGLEKELTQVPSALEEHYHEVFEFGSGCLCCNSRDELERVLRDIIEIHRTKRPYHHIILETTGLADPIFIQSLFLDEEFRLALTLDAVITVVDSKHLAQHLHGTDGKEAMEQLVFADRILLNKIDTVSSSELDEVERTVRTYNARAAIIKYSWGAVESAQLLGLRAFSTDNLPADRAARLAERTASNAHSGAVSAFLLLGRGATQLSRSEFSAWLAGVLATHSTGVYRLKGLVSFAAEPECTYIVQGVHKDFTIDRLPAAGDKLVKLLFIGKDLPRDELLKEFRKVMPQAQLMS